MFVNIYSATLPIHINACTYYCSDVLYYAIERLTLQNPSQCIWPGLFIVVGIKVLEFMTTAMNEPALDEHRFCTQHFSLHMLFFQEKGMANQQKRVEQDTAYIVQL